MRTYKITVYKAADGHRWRMKAGNGRIVADSGEAYGTRLACEKAVVNLCGGKIIPGDGTWEGDFYYPGLCYFNHDLSRKRVATKARP